jgi:hypothetical protein
MTQSNPLLLPVKRQRPGEGRIKNGEGGEFKYDIFDNCENFCKCHNVPPPSTTIKE